MELRNPATYGCQQCPHRNGKQVITRAPAQMQSAPTQARRSTATALSQQQPAAPAAKPAPEPVVQPIAPIPPPMQPKRVWLSAYAKDFTLTIGEGEHKQPLPLEAQRAEGGMAVSEGITTAPEDGYYMLLWELGVGSAQGEVTLQLGVNACASQLTYALHPGYDNGQQVTWLSAGDQVGLFLQTECEDAKAEVQCTSAQFTVIRLG